MQKSASKLVIMCSLLLAVATTASAGDSTVVLASLKKDMPLRKQAAPILPAITEKDEYYDIKGDSENDLQAQMKQKGISWGDGKKYGSITSWHVKWDYAYDRAPQTCAPESFRITAEIVIRYPHWLQNDDAPHPLVAKWESYMKNLIVHEEGHRDLVVDAAKELSLAVAALPPTPTCADLDRKIRSLCRTRMSRLNDEERKYDVTTEHGRTQGAIFP